ncbi:MAG: rod shape-determining protein MreC [Haliscomenobacter sp.]|nr:rod shape-determining protein MreC [Haliscomenobacter sp.]MBK8655123.1 rod shape-determining protein MreC [Haliscomenobacter sp.]MBP9075385.1 rod shape-determining protein MreC [Haliscomenobacter sp.]MBP9872892.1 rod shape-determining protein MreC [Haliscomenobacter sp.]
MFGLLRLLARFGAVFLFLFLEGICMYLIVRFNENQKAIFASSASYFTGSALNQYQKVTRYARLQKQVESLQKEVSRLENESWKMYYLDQAKTDTARMRLDTLGLVPVYSVVEAQVINNSVSGAKNMLTINRGKKHGVSPPMGVITSNGIVGIVRHSTEHFSSVMSVLNTQTRISASVKGKGYFGSLVWKGTDPRHAWLLDVPKHNPVHPGDTIETSGFSTLFPKGVLVGVVRKRWVPSGESNYLIQVELSADLTHVNQVYVVKNLFRKEFDQLEQLSANE